MKNLKRSSRWGLRPLLVLWLAVLLCGLPITQTVALADAPDVYLQATYITVAPIQIAVELDLTPGVLVAPAILPLLDPDGNEQITEAEGRAYVEAPLREVVLQAEIGFSCYSSASAASTQPVSASIPLCRNPITQ